MWTFIVILILVGILMLLLEILVIPGSGIAGIVGFGLMISGVWMAYSREGIQAGHITLAVTLGLNLIGLIIALRSKTWNKAMLGTSISSRMRTIDPAHLKVGDRGKTISRCAPMGKAIFNDRYFEVSAMSEFIDQDVEIEILKITGNKVIVKPIQN